MEEKIFVVVPVYKVEPYLERCIDSILNQTYQNYELVLVDDGSPDNCGAICDRYAAEHENITVIHQKNGGISAARNAGIDYAFQHGNSAQDWINFLDSDDFVHPKYLEYLYRAAAESGVNISSCGFIRTEAADIASAESVPLTYDCLSPEAYLSKNTANANVAWGKLYRLFQYKSILYPTGRIYEDDFTTHKLLFRHTEIAVIWTPLYYWYLNRESISASQWKPSRIDKLDALESQLTFFATNNFPAAYKSVVESLFLHSVLQLRAVHALSPKYDHFLKQMRQRQARAFKLYSSYYGYLKALQTIFDIRIRRPLKRKFKVLFSRICSR